MSGCSNSQALPRNASIPAQIAFLKEISREFSEIRESGLSDTERLSLVNGSNVLTKIEKRYSTYSAARMIVRRFVVSSCSSIIDTCATLKYLCREAGVSVGNGDESGSHGEMGDEGGVCVDFDGVIEEARCLCRKITGCEDHLTDDKTRASGLCSNEGCVFEDLVFGQIKARDCELEVMQRHLEAHKKVSHVCCLCDCAVSYTFLLPCGHTFMCDACLRESGASEKMFRCFVCGQIASSIERLLD